MNAEAGAFPRRRALRVDTFAENCPELPRQHGRTDRWQHSEGADDVSVTVQGDDIDWIRIEIVPVDFFSVVDTDVPIHPVLEYPRSSAQHFFINRASAVVFGERSQHLVLPIPWEH